MIPEGFVFSQSSLQSFLNCPCQFELMYLTKLAWPAQKYADTENFERDLAAGSALHQAIHRYLLGFDEYLIIKRLQVGSDPRIPIWFDNFRSRFSYLREKSNFIAEIPITIAVEPYWLTAKFDYLFLVDEKATIFDWKTSAKKPNKVQLQDSMQTKVYLTVAHNNHLISGKKLPTIRYWEANFPDLELVFTPDNQSLQRYAQGLENLIKQISMELEFPKTTVIKRCVYCRYRSYCNRGAIPGEAASDEAFDFVIAEGSEKIVSES